MTLSRSTATVARHEALTLKVLPALLLGCFIAQPLFAQTAAPATSPAQPAAKSAPAQTATSAPATAPATGTGKSATSGTTSQQSGGSDEDMSTVQVVATRPTNRIDRDVYELKNDISVSNASAADILNNVPSVTVDQDGNVTLRGNSNVQIMVNGKRDAQFQGQNRGDALNSFPAEALESIEVINVPGAEFGNEGGSGPIINLVLKRNRKPGSRANLSANKNNASGYRGFLNGEHVEGPYSISGNISVSKQTGHNHGESERQDLDPSTGTVIGGSNSTRDNQRDGRNIALNSTFTYNVGERDQAGATASYSKRHANNTNTSSTQRFGLGMTPTSDFTSQSFGRSPSENFGFGASYDHRSGEPGEALKFDLRYTGQNGDRDTDVFYDYRLRPTTRYSTNSQRENDTRNRILDISIDYEKILWESWSMKTGAKYADSKNNNATDYLAVDPITGEYVPVPSHISDFVSNDRNAAIYATLSTKLFSNLTVLAGLRGEYTEMGVRQPLFNQENKYYYTNWLPSFYANKILSDTGQLQLKLGRRVQRPSEQSLNPNLVYVSDFSATQGDPQLQPVYNTSYELGYIDRFFNIDSVFRIYRRRESPVISNRSYPLPSDPDVLVSSPLNFGVNDKIGLELNFNIHRLFINGLSANLNVDTGNQKRTRVSNLTTTSTLEVEQTTHQETVGLKLAYQMETDQLQLFVKQTGRSLTGQGSSSGSTTANLSWRHNFTDRLSMNVNIPGVYRKGSMTNDIENEVLRLHSVNSLQPRVIAIGLSYRWGGVSGDSRIRNGGGRGAFRGQGGGRGGDGGGFGGDGGGGGGFGGGGFGGGGGGGGRF